jgi:hypothetical protein
MSARIVERASVVVPLPGRDTDAATIAADPALTDALRTALLALAAAARGRSTESEAEPWPNIERPSRPTA